jgi:hypothetical protein
MSGVDRLSAVCRRWMQNRREHDASLKHPLFPALLDQLRAGQWEVFRAVFRVLPTDERHVVLCGIAQRANSTQEFTAFALNDGTTGALVHAAVLAHHAWQARTGRRASAVPTDKAARFVHLLNAAHDGLMAAHRGAPLDPEPLARLIPVLMGLEADGSVILRCYEQLAADGRPHLPAGYDMVEALSLKWGGDAGAMFGFARTQSQVQPGHGSLLAYAHIEQWVSERMERGEGACRYFRASEVRRDILHAYDRDRMGLADNYYGLIARGVYALCFYHLGEQYLARQELTAIGDRHASKPWVYLDGVPRRAVNKVRRWAGLEAL